MRHGIPAILLLLFAFTVSLSAQEMHEKLEASVVSGRAPSVTVVGDTLLFSSSVYRLADDASLEDLLRKIPGVEVNGGVVTLYGKLVSELRVNGKRFFGGDVTAGLQNIPAEMVDKIGAYERSSDFTSITGVDDGEMVSVLDIKIKQDFLDGWKGRASAGGGTKGRFLTKFNANKVTDSAQSSLVAGCNNLPRKASFNNATRTQLGGGSAGNALRGDAGFSLARNAADKEYDFNFRYLGGNSDIESVTRTQNIYSGSTSFANGSADRLSRNHNPKADLRYLWKPDKKTTLLLKPSFSYTGTDIWSHTLTDNFKKDPFAPEDPGLTSSADNRLVDISHKVNGRMVLIWTRKFSKKGRSLSLQTDDTFNLRKNGQGTNYRTRYNRTKEPTDTTRRQFVSQDDQNLSFSLQGSWNEPVGKGIFLQFTARGEYKDRSSERSLYDITRNDNSWTVQDFGSIRKLMDSLPEPLDYCFMDEASYDGKYRYYALALYSNIRVIRPKYNYTLGIRVTPAWQQISWPQGGKDNTISSDVCYVAPNIQLNYHPSKRKKLTFSYRSSIAQPSIYNLLPVSNGTNPLYVHIGNPGLKPSNTHITELTYNGSSIKTGSSITADVELHATENSISNSTEYDPETGGRTVIPKNISGNWYSRANLALSKSFEKAGITLGSHTSSRYDNNCNFLYNKTLHEDEKNITRRLMVKESLRANYRNNWLDMTLDVGGDYTAERSLLRPDLDQNPWSLVASLSGTVQLPWRMRIGSDVTHISQRGFAYGDFNKDYLVLNASLSQSFFKGRLLATVEGFDLLGSLPNMTRRFSSESRSISVFNGVNSYVILRLSWRIK